MALGMNIARSTIWRVPAYLPYVQAPLSLEVIEAAQKQLGVTLPVSYLELLGIQNGGYVRRAMTNAPHSRIWGIGEHYPTILRSHEWQAADAVEDDYWIPSQPQLLIPFDGDGHWYLCFDYRKSGGQGNPSVTYIDLEAERETSVAESFESFLVQLSPQYGSTNLGITGSYELSTVARALEEKLGAAFESQGVLSNGYDVWRAKLSDDAGPAWVWLSPNRVARGFVRPSDPRYNELKDLLPGTALRHPEHPDVGLELSFTENARARVLEACDRAGLPFVRLDGKR